MNAAMKSFPGAVYPDQKIHELTERNTRLRAALSASEEREGALTAKLESLEVAHYARGLMVALLRNDRATPSPTATAKDQSR